MKKCSRNAMECNSRKIKYAQTQCEIHRNEQCIHGWVTKVVCEPISCNCWKKTFHCNDHAITEFGITDKTPLLHMLYYMNWLTHDCWTRTGGWVFDRSGSSSPSHWQQVEEQAPSRNLWVGRCVSSRWPWFPSRSSVLLYIYMHSLYEFC